MHSLDFTSYLLLAMSLLFIGLPVFLYLKKKPLIIDMRWTFVFIILGFSPMITSSIEMFFEEPEFDFLSLFPIIMVLTLIVFYAFILKGYSVMGADGAEFQKYLIESIKDKNLEFEQSLSSIKISNPELEFNVAIQPWMGVAQIRQKTKTDKEVLKSIIEQVKTKNIKTNYTTSIFYLVFGAILATMSLYLILNPIEDILPPM